jgi:hypothetical protein
MGNTSIFKEIQSTDDGLDEPVAAMIEGVLNANQLATEYGPDAPELIAKAFQRAVTVGTTKEQVEDFKQRYKPPQNAKELGVPKVNREIWGQLPRRAQTSDAASQYIQQHISRALVAQVQLVELITESARALPTEKTKMMLTLCMDTANSMGSAQREINSRRRAQIKPFLTQACVGICTPNTPVTEFLFGDNLEKDLTASRTSARILRSVTGVRPFNRFGRSFRGGTSMSQGYNGRPLNLRQPLSPRGGMKNFRGRGRQI